MNRRIRALLIDLSGTLHVGADPIAGAARAIQRLRDHKIPFRFCSNTSKESTNDLLKRLRDAGFIVHEDELFTSLNAMKRLLTERGIKRPLLLLSPSALDDFKDLSDEDNSAQDHDAVVVGLAPNSFTYNTLNQAFRILSSSNGQRPIPLLTTHRARYVRSSSGELSLGPGPFVTTLEVGVGDGCKAEIVGKPARAFFEVCLRDLGVGRKRDISDEDGQRDGEELKADHVAIIGDDIEADLGGGALELGLNRILVKTGKYRKGDEMKAGITPPDSVYESIAEIVDALLEEKGKSM
ncbi:hypothetical protein M408DRAFT_14632 [Serendipita vermifera MAFF 305830]|uniref:Haloacid dehalogenase-like hydrolase domain-containing protein 2 n=1 Tax=Serendipita vermifera MAFF 305830 TaxID=933852 RepID=A0A0C2X1J4_SERVB|nr:hypothetical protein M408DRAFT_14632 [Serendipita vermifera MAFF 305830]